MHVAVRAQYPCPSTGSASFDTFSYKKWTKESNLAIINHQLYLRHTDILHFMNSLLMLKRLLHQTWALRDNLALQCQYCNTKILTGICSTHHDNRRHMYRIKYSRHVAFDSINNVWMLLFAILNTIFIPWTELEELLNGPLTPSKQTFGFQTPKGHSLSLFIYQNVKHFTVKEKPQFGKSQVFPFSQQTIWTVSMLHSLHEGLDWWNKNNNMKYNPTDLKNTIWKISE